MKKISTSKDKFEQLKKDNKIEFLKPEVSKKETLRFHEFLDQSRRLHVIKNANSIRSAADTILTT